MLTEVMHDPKIFTLCCLAFVPFLNLYPGVCGPKGAIRGSGIYGYALVPQRRINAAKLLEGGNVTTNGAHDPVEGNNGVDPALQELLDSITTSTRTPTMRHPLGLATAMMPEYLQSILPVIPF